MIPARWTSVRSLPLLTTGKIDRQALKAKAAADEVDRAGPAALESTDGIGDAVAAIWREVLGVADVRPDDHFFDCGGHSLLAVQMLSKVEATFGVEIGVRALFEAPTPAALSQAIAQLTSAPASARASRTEGELRTVASAGRAQHPGGLAESGRRASPTAGTSSPEDVAAGLLDIWRELLGTRNIGPADDFFDLGGHSLLATRLSAAIEERFGIAIPLSALFSHGTIDEQTRLLVEVMPADDWTPIVSIQPGGSEPPLFLVHGIGGQVISFQALGRHLTDIPVYGLEADRRHDEHDTLTVERVAATYAAAITRVDPDGPYRIGGYSAGGLIALEIAQQLRHGGRSVSSLVMLDAPAKVTRVIPLTPVAIARLIRNGVYWLVDDDFLRSGWAIQRARIQHRLRAMSSRSASSRDGRRDGLDIRDRLGLWGLPASMNPFIEQMSRMLRAYKPQPYAGAITVISARTHSLFFVTGKDLGWTRFARGGLTTRIVRGAHDTILREPRVRTLAAILLETLRADR
jgi:thioesterase domain-containing protein/acyl carrier protein